MKITLRHYIDYNKDTTIRYCYLWSISALCLTFKKCLEETAIRGSLLSLGTESDIMNAILVHLVLSKVDADTNENYDEKQEFKSLPSWDACY